MVVIHLLVGIAGPAHEEVESFLLDRREAEPLKQSQGRIKRLHKDADRLAGLGGFRHDLANQQRAGAAVAIFWQQRDIEDVKGFGRAVEVQTAARLAVNVDHRMRGPRVLCGVMHLLRFKLRSHELLFLFRRPGHKRQFLGAGASVYLQQECVVRILDGTKCELGG